MDALMQRDTMLVASMSLLLSVLTVTSLIVVILRQARLLNRYKLLLNGESKHDLEGLLLAQGVEIGRLKVEGDALTAQVARLEREAKAHVQKTATIRFNAFPDTGSDLSFVIAMLDGNDNGVVVSSLYGRSESRVYAKPITSGKSTYMLSDEEKAALAKATGAERH